MTGPRPLTCTVFRSTDPEHLSGLPEYFGALEDFCPFVRPALKTRVLFYSCYRIEPRLQDWRTAQDVVFLCSLFHTLWFHHYRTGIQNHIEKDLYTENVFFSFDCENLPPVALAKFSHWLLRALFTESGIVFGRFWSGERSERDPSRQLPNLPLTILISIRSPRLPTDEFFFRKTPGFLPPLRQSSRDGGIFTHLQSMVGQKDWTLVQSALGEFKGGASATRFVEIGLDLQIVKKIEVMAKTKENYAKD